MMKPLAPPQHARLPRPRRAAAAALLVLLCGCNTFFDPDEVVLEPSSDTAVADTAADSDASDTALDQASDLDPADSDTLDPADTDLGTDAADGTEADGTEADGTETDASDAVDDDDTVDADATEDTEPDVEPLDCTGQCGPGTNCQACGEMCVDVLVSTQYCGSCAGDCTSLPNVNVVNCFAGVCQISTIEGCQPGWADCDGIASNGCEANLNSTATCGSCTNACSAIEFWCINGRCSALPPP